VIRPADPPIPRGTVSPLVFVPRDPPPESGPGHFTLALSSVPRRVGPRPTAPSCRASPTSRRSRSVQVGRSRRRRESACFSIALCPYSLWAIFSPVLILEESMNTFATCIIRISQL